ncbi:MAG: glycine oxidase ThiO [Planctomycetes bacterium]|nr:glycine oxidase ThiO [Planctomycetota bacterium]
MTDCLIVGAGVMGLSLAYELAGRGLSVRVLERGQPGSEASWAGAGILPPATDGPGASPYDRLTALSLRLHRQWADELRQATAVDTGYRRCGALYVAGDKAAAASLRQQCETWRAQDIRCQPLDRAELASLEPSLEEATLAVRVPDECQLRNPRHLRALAVACHQRGVMIDAGNEVTGVIAMDGRVTGLRTSAGTLTAGHYCLTTGAWAQQSLPMVRPRTSLRPIRGQMVLLNAPEATLRHIVNDGPRYLVPRGDGRILVGSTEEDVGFDKRNTARAVAELLAFASRWSPMLADATVERCWAGLRPFTEDGLPMLGRVPRLSNLYLAAGHFRSGLTQSPGTALLISQLILGEAPALDLHPFRVGEES